jgi:indole-3-glycerol phosphate synthase
MFLEDILNHKKNELKAKKSQQPLDSLYRQISPNIVSRPFIPALRGNFIRLIAEVKKASPSKGLLCPDFDPVVLGKSYERAGAAAISVLTDERFFQGSIEYLRRVKAETGNTPILLKDFIIDRYQLVEAKLYGADAVLLIVAALTWAELNSLIQEALALGLTPLVEVHNHEELHLALEANAEVIGINNRDLKTFSVNLDTTFKLLEHIPAGITVVSESGIHSHQDVRNLSQAGVHAVLVGESIVTAADPEVKIRELMGVTA